MAGEVLDTALTLFFSAPRSYTGENCAELHVHGGPGVIDSVTDTLLALGLRLAEPGEFTRRAFENGKLDLDQAEAVADLVEAETRNQTRQALGQLEGRLGERYKAWRNLLVEALARLEAAVDFPDEEIPAGVVDQARAALERLAGDLDLALADEGRGQRVREGYRVAIVGAPNAGKSSLVNALAGRDAAIVTHIPGATRDIIEVPLVIEGYKVLLADTAGIRVSHEPIEVEGVRRARAWASSADLRLWLVDQGGDTGAWREALDLVRAGDILVLNKSDLEAGIDLSEARAAAAASIWRHFRCHCWKAGPRVLDRGWRRDFAKRCRARTFRPRRGRGMSICCERRGAASGGRWMSCGILSWPPKMRGWPPAPWRASAVASMPRMCWSASSPLSASASEVFHVKQG